MPTLFQLLEHQLTLLKPFSSLCLIFLIFIPFLIKRLLFKNQKIRKNLPPSPPKLPILGNLHQLGLHPHRSLQKLSQRYGPVMFLSLGSSPAVVVSSPEGAREIMQTHDLIFANRPESKIYKKLFYNMSDVSTAPYGEYWRQLKSICVMQLLSKKRVSSFRSVREEEISLVMEMIKDQSCFFSKPVNLSEMFSLIANNVVCRATFGKKYDGGDNGKKFRELLIDFFELIGTANIEDFLPWLAWVNHLNGTNAKADRVAREFDDFLEEVVEERLGRFEGEESHIGDLVDVLIGIYKNNETSNSLGRDSVKAIILDMFAGATDTTSTLLDWSMIELLRQPRIMKKLQDEVRCIAKGNPYVIEDDLQEMHYLKAFLKETLRYYPPVPTLVPRKSSQDVKVMGYDIPSGSVVIINAWALARDNSLWDDPEEFKPERFLNSSIEYKGQDFEYIPFGSGRRGCPGMLFSMVTAELALANIVHKFDWDLPNGAKGIDLDMSEGTGVIIRRKASLLAIPTQSS